MEARFSNFSIDHILAPHSDSLIQHPRQQATTESCPHNISSPAAGPHFYRSSQPVGVTLMQRFGIPVALHVSAPTFSFCSECLHNVSTNYRNLSVGHHPDPLMYEPAFQAEQMLCPHTGSQRHRSRMRTVFTDSQTKQLDHLFCLTAYPSVEARAELARNIGLNEETVRIWFKNRRARRKRQSTRAKSPESHRDDHREGRHWTQDETHGIERSYFL